MGVYDRWHRQPQPGEQACRCSRGKGRLYPSSSHLAGDRWQVRWRDPFTGKQRKRNFALKDGPDPDRHAAAFDAAIQGSIVTRNYTDPKAGSITLEAYARQWQAGRKADVNNAADVERRLRLHVYADPEDPDSGRTVRGGLAIGQHPMGLLARRPSLVSAWIASLPLAPGTALHVVTHVSAVFAAAIDDGIVGANPVRAGSVKLPSAGRTLARAWSLDMVRAVAAELPPRWRVVPELGAGTGMRRGEMLGLGVADIGFLERDPRVAVSRSLKLVGGQLRFGPVKNRKPHAPPLAQSVAVRRARHLEEFPARTVTLPWHDPGDRERHGMPVTVALVVSNDDGSPVNPDWFSLRWGRARKRAGITPEGRRGREDGCHALRHTAASRWLRERIDIVRVAAWLGDTVQMVASTYAHLMPDDDDDDGRAAVDAFFAGTDAPDVPDSAASRK